MPEKAVRTLHMSSFLKALQESNIKSKPLYGSSGGVYFLSTNYPVPLLRNLTLGSEVLYTSLDS